MPLSGLLSRTRPSKPASPAVVQSVDQPCPAEILTALYEAAETDGVDVALPLYDERPGHPICLSGLGCTAGSAEELVPERTALTDIRAR